MGGASSLGDLTINIVVLKVSIGVLHAFDMWGFPKIGGPQYSTLNSRILILRTPPNKVPLFSETPMYCCQAQKPSKSGRSRETKGYWALGVS